MTSLPCQICEELRPDQVRVTRRLFAVYVALVCDECHEMVGNLDRMQGVEWARVYRLVTGTGRIDAF